MDILVVPVLMLSVGLAVVLMAWGSERTEIIDQAWSAAAEKLGGSFEPARGLSSGRRIVAEVRGKQVTVAHQALSAQRSGALTRVRCPADGPLGLKLRVTPAGGFSGLARAVGFEDVSVGDADFDTEYIVKANDPALARLWLHEKVRQRLMAVPDFRFKLERGRVEAECATLVDETEVIVAAVEAALSFSDGRKRLIAAWRKLAREHDGTVAPIAGSWARLQLQVSGTPVAVSTLDLRDKHFTAVTAEARERLPEIVLTREPHLYEASLPQLDPCQPAPPGYTVFTHEPARVASVFDAWVVARMAELKPAKVRLDADRATVLLAGIETRTKILRRAIELSLRLSAAVAVSPYR